MNFSELKRRLGLHENPSPMHGTRVRKVDYNPVTHGTAVSKGEYVYSSIVLPYIPAASTLLIDFSFYGQSEGL